MKDDIKEILDILKDDVYVPLEDGRDYKLLYKDDDKLLLDYITNLQEENEHLQKQNKGLNNLIIQHIDEEDNLIDYKSRNEKAIEYIKQYREIYYPDEPLSEPIIQYGLGIYEEDFDEEKLLNILQGEDKDE